MKRAISIVFIVALALLLLYVVDNMPPMGDAGSPTNSSEITRRYLDEAEDEVHAQNVVTGILVNYRGYDTLGEVTVIYCALAAVLAVLGREKRGRVHAHADRLEVASSVIVKTAVRFLVPFIVLFSAYTILHGVLKPGGGFQGGAVIGGSMIVFTTIFGLYESSARIPQGLRFSTEGAALITFFTVGVLGLVGGGEFLTFAWPNMAENLQPSLVSWLTVIIEIGIGLGGAMVFISILFSMIREGEEVALVA